MQIIHSDIKKGSVKVKATNLNDLWCLSSIIDKEDIISGSTTRKIKIGGEDERSAKVFKKHVYLKIKAEKIEFTSNAGESAVLRVSGPIIEGPEDVSRGSYHTFSIEEGTVITIIKNKWLSFQLQKIKEASSEKMPAIMICVFDREEAYIARLKGFGYEMLAKLAGDVVKKTDIEAKKNDFYAEIIKIIKEYDEKYNFENIILASPAFWKEYLINQLNENGDEKLKKKIVSATCSSCDEPAINEVLKRQEVVTVLKQDRTSREIKLVDALFEEIAKQGKAIYGFIDVKKAAGAGAVEKVIITDEFIQKAKEHNKYDEIDALLRMIESMKGEVFIVSSLHDGGKRLDGLGGIGALLRYKLEWNN